MRIIYARRMGFCQGVRRAYEETAALATSLASMPSGGEAQAFMLGDLVHNRQVVERIASYGIQRAEINSLPEGARVIIRTHGETRLNIERLLASGSDIIDLTCAVVKSVRERAAQLQKRHPAVVVVGKKDHPEVEGLVSYLDNPHVVTFPEEAAEMPDYSSIGVVAQTTIGRERYREVLAALVARFGESRVEALDTICPHTDEAQQSAREAAISCDIMLVVGDAHSSNTRRLLEVCAEANPRSHFLSCADEIDPAWFPSAGSVEWVTLSVGITAGASTPDWVVAEIAERVVLLSSPAQEEKREV